MKPSLGNIDSELCNSLAAVAMRASVHLNVGVIVILNSHDDVLFIIDFAGYVDLGLLARDGNIWLHYEIEGERERDVLQMDSMICYDSIDQLCQLIWSFI